SDFCIEVCNDGQDNNLNGFIDCDDIECKNSLICEEICGDGIDNNKNQIINTDSLEYNKCLDKKEKFMEAYCSTMPLFDKACTEKGGIGDSCNNNGDCFWQPKAFEKDSCINSLCTAHPDIYAISPPPKTCNDQLDCDYPELCKEVAYAGMFEEPICQKIKESFNKCVECLDPDCKFTEVCN
ncbi:hypothetical protein HOC13_03135, partial [Candidatus Woesearchaeota archaeon]|nr:hypothetical protein [Candidatus Woesearchaeota archaeon]